MHTSKTFFEKNPYNPKVDNMSEKESDTCMYTVRERENFQCMAEIFTPSTSLQFPNGSSNTSQYNQGYERHYIYFKI